MKWLKSYWLILVFLFLTSPTLKFSQQIEESTRFKGVRLLVKDDQSGKAEIINLYKKVFAVIIGIDLYKNLSPDRHLRYPVSDAKAIEKMMRGRFVFDEIITLYNNEATREAIMADACYSGLLATRGEMKKSGESARDIKYLRLITKEPVRQILTAGGKDEKVLDGGPYGHSVFVGRILQILENTTDYITASELSVKLKEVVFSDANAMGHTQIPSFGALYGSGDFVFVPRVEKGYDEVHAEVLKLKEQLKEINQQSTEFEKLNSVKEQKQALLKEEELKAQLKAKQLEEERLLKEKERKAWLEQEEKRLAQEEEQKKRERENQKIAEEKELVQLRQKIAEEELKLKSIKQAVISIDVARKEVEILKGKITGVISLINPQKEKALKRLEEDYRSLIQKLETETIPPRDQFETLSDYNARIQTHQDKISALEQKYSTEYSEIATRFENEIQSLTKPYKDQINELESRKYPADGLAIHLIKYDAERKIYRVQVEEMPSKLLWFYSLSIEPEKARKLFDKESLLKVEGYYKSLYNTNSLSEVYVIDPSGERYQLHITGIKLRSEYLEVQENDVISMLKEKGFFDSNYNPQVEFNNEFEVMKIGQDTVIFDYATNLIWHVSVEDPIIGLFRSSKSKMNRWIDKQNKKPYAGLHNWRLPTLEEAASLLKRSKNSTNNLHITPIFPYASEVLTGDKAGIHLRSVNIKKVEYLYWIVDLREGKVNQGVLRFAEILLVHSMQ